MSTCATCRWFSPSDYDGPHDPETGDELEPGRWGTCSFILDSGGVVERYQDGQLVREVKPHSARAYPQDASGYSAWLVVRQDFGCVEHEERVS